MMLRCTDSKLSERAQAGILHCKQELAEAPAGSVVTIIIPADGLGLEILGITLQDRTDLVEVYRVLAPSLTDDDTAVLVEVAARVEKHPGDEAIWIVVLDFDADGLREVDARRARRQRHYLVKGGDA